MRKKIFCLFLILCFICTCCEPKPEPIADGWFPPRELKPYDPEKAGAVVVEYFDLTNDLIFPDKKVSFVPSNNNIRIKDSFNLAEYNDNIYIHIIDNIYVFEKSTFVKKNEIRIIFPDSGYTETEYNIMLKQGEEAFYDQRNLGFDAQGIVVIGNRMLLLCYNTKQKPYPTYLFSVDLNTGEASLLDTMDTEIKKYYMPIIGCDANSKNLIWFKGIEGGANYYHSLYFYFYDEDTHNFTKDRKCHIPYNINKYNQSYRLSISENTVWNTSYGGVDLSTVWDIGIEKRTLDDPDTSLHFIDVEHLGTLSVPQSLVFDDPYIWIMVERDDQVQMLKLLPNE